MQRRRSMKRFHATTDERGVSAATLGELWLGRLQARDPEAATRRLSAYQLAQRFEELTVDDAVSEAWALLVPYVPLKAVAPVHVRKLRRLISAGFQGCMSIPGWSGRWRRVGSEAGLDRVSRI